MSTKRHIFHPARLLPMTAILLLGSVLTDLTHAQITLELTASDGLQGTVSEAGLKVTTDVELAGFNAEIVLPDGVGIDSVLKGDLLTPADNFQLAFAIDGQSLRVVTWSGNTTFSGSGSVLHLTLQLGAELLGLKELAFATDNPDPLVNSQHAVSNADGSVSLQHEIANASFLVYSQDSDHDDDEMPDAWEIEFGLDPLTDNSADDADEDGYTNLEEYLAGSDPTDPLSTPDRIFGDGFESGANQ